MRTNEVTNGRAVEVLSHSPEEERQGRSRAGDGDVTAASEETRWWSVCLARQSEKRTRVPESAMAVAARARPAWEPPSAEPAPAEEEEDDDMAQ